MSARASRINLSKNFMPRTLSIGAIDWYVFRSDGGGRLMVGGSGGFNCLGCPLKNFCGASGFVVCQRNSELKPCKLAPFWSTMEYRGGPCLTSGWSRCHAHMGVGHRANAGKDAASQSKLLKS
eukprot:677841-Pelagomonas_calceolata.AAC.2